MLTFHITHYHYPVGKDGFVHDSDRILTADDYYYVELESGTLISIRKNNSAKKYIRVVEDKRYEFVYRVQKTQIKAIGGARRFMEHLADALTPDSPFDLVTEDLVENIYAKVKEAKESEIRALVS